MSRFAELTRRSVMLSRAGFFFAALLLVSACQNEPQITRERTPRQLGSDKAGITTSTFTLYERPPEPVVHGECVAGETRLCPIARFMTKGGDPLVSRCECTAGRGCRFNHSACNTPLVVSLDEAKIEFTRPPGTFMIGADARTEWVSSKTPWLALDVDGSGCIESQAELFGPPEDGKGKNGFAKLARLDANGDGRIDARDSAFAKLVLWSDSNADRACTPSEMRSLADAGVVALDLAYATPASTPFGSHEGETARLWFKDKDGDLVSGRVVDVYLAPIR